MRVEWLRARKVHDFEGIIGRLRATVSAIYDVFQVLISTNHISESRLIVSVRDVTGIPIACCCVQRSSYDRTRRPRAFKEDDSLSLRSHSITLQIKLIVKTKLYKAV